MSDSLQDRFPDLYFDEKTVVEKSPKASPPSIGQIFAKILVANGIQNPGVAADLASAAEQFYKGDSTVSDLTR